MAVGQPIELGIAQQFDRSRRVCRQPRATRAANRYNRLANVGELLTEVNKDTAVIIYSSRRPPSVQAFNGLRELSGIPLAVYNARRLRAGLSAMAAKFIALVHSPDIARQLEQHLRETEIELIRSPELGMIAALNGLANLMPEVRTILVYADNAVFPDCALARDLLECHRASNAACTVAPKHPVGLAPIVIQTDDLGLLLPLDSRQPRNLAELDPFVGASQALMEAALQPDAVPFTVAAYPVAVADADLATLPSVALVRNRHDHFAARETVRYTDADQELDARSAEAYKRFLITSIYSSPVVSARGPRRAASAVPVLFSALTTDFTGAEQSLLLLLRALDRRRVHPVLAVPFDCLLARRVAEAGIAVEIADTEYQEIGRYNLEYCHALLSEYDVAVVHVDFTLNPALMIAAAQRRLPIVGHVRTVLPSVLPEIVELMDRFVCISDYVAASVHRANVPPERIVRQYNGVDRSIFYPGAHDGAALRRAAGIPPDAFVIVFVARIVPDKRHDLLIDALSVLRAQVPNAIALFVGEAMLASDEMRLRDNVARMGMEGAVKFWGYEPRIDRLYSVSDVVVVCRENEGFGRSVLEGMAMGVPAVVPAGSGSAELVEHERQGLQFQAGDAHDLARQLAHLACDPIFRQSCGQAALARSALFDIYTQAQEMADFYIEIARGNRSALSQMEYRAHV